MNTSQGNTHTVKWQWS